MLPSKSEKRFYHMDAYGSVGQGITLIRGSRVQSQVLTMVGALGMFDSFFFCLLFVFRTHLFYVVWREELSLYVNPSRWPTPLRFGRDSNLCPPTWSSHALTMFDSFFPVYIKLTTDSFPCMKNIHLKLNSSCHKCPIHIARIMRGLNIDIKPGLNIALYD